MAKIRIRHKGSLSRYGFSLHAPEKEQMKAIHKADKQYGRGEVDRKLASIWDEEEFEYQVREQTKTMKNIFNYSPV